MNGLDRKHAFAAGGVALAILAERLYLTSVHDHWDEVEGWLALGATAWESTRDLARRAHLPSSELSLAESGRARLDSAQVHALTASAIELIDREVFSALELQVALADCLRAEQKAFNDPVSKADLELYRVKAEEKELVVRYTREELERQKVMALDGGMVLFSDRNNWIGRPVAAGEKVMEEAEEVSRAVREETDDRVANEAAYRSGVAANTSRSLGAAPPSSSAAARSTRRVVFPQPTAPSTSTASGVGVSSIAIAFLSSVGAEKPPRPSCLSPAKSTEYSLPGKDR